MLFVHLQTGRSLNGKTAQTQSDPENKNRLLAVEHNIEGVVGAGNSWHTHSSLDECFCEQ